jgi:hypothetical protein
MESAFSLGFSWQSCTLYFQIFYSWHFCFNWFIFFSSSQTSACGWLPGRGFGLLKCAQQARICPCEGRDVLKIKQVIYNNDHRWPLRVSILFRIIVLLSTCSLEKQFALLKNQILRIHFSSPPLGWAQITVSSNVTSCLSQVLGSRMQLYRSHWSPDRLRWYTDAPQLSRKTETGPAFLTLGPVSQPLPMLYLGWPNLEASVIAVSTEVLWCTSSAKASSSFVWCALYYLCCPAAHMEFADIVRWLCGWPSWCQGCPMAGIQMGGGLCGPSSPPAFRWVLLQPEL